MGVQAAAPAEISAALGAKRRSIGGRARKLIDIAHPKFRDELERPGRELGFI